MSATYTLAIETSTPLGSLTAIDADGCAVSHEFSSDRSHNALLFPPLKRLLDARRGREIELVLVGSGPGSYSGTRVGIAAAQGVAIAAACLAVALPSLLAVPSAENGRACLAIGDARRGSFWTARIEHFSLVTEPELTDAAGLQNIISRALEAGLPVFTFEELQRFPVPAELVAQLRQEQPSAERLWQAWSSTASENRAKWQIAPPQPLYLKPPHITPAKRPWLLAAQV